jgi:hypothetical protein
MGVIFAVACAHDDASVVEHPVAPCAICPGLSVSVFTGGNCAQRGRIKVKHKYENQIERPTNFSMEKFLCVLE